MKLLAIEHTGGIETHREKWDWLARRSDIELTLLVPESWIENGRTVIPGPVTNSSAPSGYRQLTGRVAWRGYENRGFYVSGLARAIRTARPDIVHLMEEPFSLFALQATWLCRRLAPGARILFYTFDNLHRGFRYAYRPSPVYGWINRYVNSRSDAAVASSLDAAQVLRSRRFEKPVRFVPLGLDPERFCPRDRAALRGRHGVNGFVVGYAGRLLAMKGIAHLAAAMSGLPADTTLLVLGSGPEKGRLEETARREGWAGRLRIVDAVPQEEVPAWLNLMDVLVLPSVTTSVWREQFGRVLIEAMACGVPVIGTDSGAIPEVVGSAGFIIPEGRPEAIARAVTRLRDDRSLTERLVAAGRRRVLEHFTWERIAARYHVIYEGLLSGNLESEERPAWVETVSRDDSGAPLGDAEARGDGKAAATLRSSS